MTANAPPTDPSAKKWRASFSLPKSLRFQRCKASSSWPGRTQRTSHPYRSISHDWSQIKGSKHSFCKQKRLSLRDAGHVPGPGMSDLDRPIGRPKAAPGEGRVAVVSVWLTTFERAGVEAKAARSGLSLSDYCRRALLGHRVAASTEPQQVNTEALVELNRVGVNLNQIARVANRGERLPCSFPETLSAVLAAVERLAVGNDP